ncbi:MAG: hypothetical protein M3N53_01745 [Actinomycetota bacterium]|nr:hypothetical protein [Actinomycetota bacterium]
MPNCPVPGSGHAPIPSGQSHVDTLVNVINHLKDQDADYLEGRCNQLLTVLGVDELVPTGEQDQDVTY